LQNKCKKVLQIEKEYLYLYQQKQIDMKTTKLSEGVYRITDKQEVFIIKKVDPRLFHGTGAASWQAWGTADPLDCTDDNNWGLTFKTKRELLNYCKLF
jgi:hypothetical protein